MSFVLVPLIALLCGCVTGFTNAQRRLDARERSIFVPAVVDTTSRGGNSGRLSMAIRRAIALDTRFQLAPLEQARWALGMDLVGFDRRTEKAAECAGSQSQPDAEVASRSFTCKQLTGQLALAEVSSEEESVGLDLRVRAIDLNTGKTMLAIRYDPTRRAVFPVVGNQDVQAGLRLTPQLHALRYLENEDAAVEAMGAQIAANLLGSILSLEAQPQ